MDLNQENLPVVCVTEKNVIRGRIRGRVEQEDSNPVLLEERPSRFEFVHLVNVTVLDHERRILRRVPHLALNKAYVVFFLEDDVGPQLDRVKAMIAIEDYEGAQAELERMLAVTAGDGEIFYLAGVVHHHSGNEERARECFSRALGMTLDEKLRAVIKRHLEP